MDSAILVNQKIEEGANLIRALDSEHYPVSAAFWFLDPDDKKWKLVIASPNYDTDGPRSVYLVIQRHVSAVSEDGLALTDIAATSPNNKLIKLLRVALGTPPNAISGIWLRGNTINNTYIEAVYVYRLA